MGKAEQWRSDDWSSGTRSSGGETPHPELGLTMSRPMDRRCLIKGSSLRHAASAAMASAAYAPIGYSAAASWTLASWRLTGYPGRPSDDRWRSGEDVEGGTGLSVLTRPLMWTDGFSPGSPGADPCVGFARVERKPNVPVARWNDATSLKGKRSLAPGLEGVQRGSGG
eukprot:4483175-Pyramimonas_sp.AAC.1